MPNNSIKILFLVTLISGVLISLSANSWMGAWMGLEINLLSFIPLLSSNKNMYSTEASLKYFLIQAIASSSLLFLIILKTSINEIFHFLFLSWNNLIMTPLLMKIACAPLHWWLPSMIEGITWMNCFILLTIQKIAPMVLISYILLNNSLYIQMLIINTVIIGAIGGMNQTSLRKILSFSSINHIGWMLMTMIMGFNLWFTYFIIYMFNILPIIFMMMMFNMSFVSQTFNLMNNNKMIKCMMFLSLLSLGGLPPFLGFFPKWIVIQFMIMNLMIPMSFILILSSLLTLFYYIRIMYASLMIANSEVFWSSIIYPKNNHYPLFIMPSLTMILLGMITSTILVSIY